MSSIDDNKYSNSQEIQRRLSHALNYNNWLFGKIEKYTGSRILEIGCALGNFTKKILDRNFVYAIDIEEEYIKAIKSCFEKRNNFKAARYDITLTEVLALKDNKFDTVICLNVLEHIKNDDIALAHM